MRNTKPTISTIKSVAINILYKFNIVSHYNEVFYLSIVIVINFIKLLSIDKSQHISGIYINI